MHEQRQGGQTRQELGARIRGFRTNKGLTSRQLAARAGMSQSKISKIENGWVHPSPSDLAAITSAMTLSHDVTVRLIDDFRELKQTNDSSYDRLQDLRANAQAKFAKLEGDANSIDCYCTTTVPALLQTPAYSRALFSAGASAVRPDSLNHQLVVRAERQAKLFDDQKRFRLLMLESALHFQHGSVAEMRAQYEKLLDLDDYPNVEFLVVPQLAESRLVGNYTFAIMDGKCVDLDVLPVPIQLTDAYSVAATTELFEYLWTQGNSGSTAMIIEQMLKACSTDAIDLTSVS